MSARWSIRDSTSRYTGIPTTASREIPALERSPHTLETKRHRRFTARVGASGAR